MLPTQKKRDTFSRRHGQKAEEPRKAKKIHIIQKEKKEDLEVEIVDMDDDPIANQPDIVIFSDDDSGVTLHSPTSVSDS